MGFPASVTTVTVTGRWRYADGSTGIPTGYVTFTPNAVLQVPADGDILPVRQVKATLDGSGAISVQLMSTADPDVEPTGWAYIVNEFVGGQERIYLAGFPAVAPGQIYDLSGIAPAVSDPVFTYVLLASVGTIGGPAGPLDGTGKIPSSQVPASGASVTSVNGHTGVVVLGAADVGADAAGAAAAAQAASQPLDSDLTAFAALVAAGFVVRTGAGAVSARTLTGSSETGVTNGDGVAGNPTLTVTAVAPTASAVGDTSTSGGVATHRHPREGFGAVTAQTTFAAASANGTATTVSHSDHAHGTPDLAAQYSAFADVTSLGTSVSQGVPHFQQRTEPGTITRLQGQLAFAAATFAANSLLATLNGNFPAASTRFLVRTVGSSTVTVITIGTDGTIRNVSAFTSAGSDTINFDGLTFVHA